MAETVSATEARIHLGELMQRAVDEQTTIIIERSGRPHVVMLSVDAYERLIATQGPGPDWRDLVDQARDQMRSDLKGTSLPAPDEVLAQLREARDGQLVGLRRR